MKYIEYNRNLHRVLPAFSLRDTAADLFLRVTSDAFLEVFFWVSIMLEGSIVQNLIRIVWISLTFAERIERPASLTTNRLNTPLLLTRVYSIPIEIGEHPRPIVSLADVIDLNRKATIDKLVQLENERVALLVFIFSGELSDGCSINDELAHRRLCQYLFWPWMFTRRGQSTQRLRQEKPTFKMSMGIDGNTWRHQPAATARWMNAINARTKCLTVSVAISTVPVRSYFHCPSSSAMHWRTLPGGFAHVSVTIENRNTDQLCSGDFLHFCSVDWVEIN